MAVTLSYPKPRSLQTKVIAIARADSSTEKCVLPKHAVICDVHVLQNVDSSTAAAAVDVGWSGDTNGILAAFSMATTAVGLVNAGTAAGTGVMTKLDSDKIVISTFTAGSSSAGGTGYVIISYFVAGPNEDVTG
jgi:hypothetical protein